MFNRLTGQKHFFTEDMAQEKEVFFFFYSVNQRDVLLKPMNVELDYKRLKTILPAALSQSYQHVIVELDALEDQFDAPTCGFLKKGALPAVKGLEVKRGSEHSVVDPTLVANRK